MSQRSIEHLVRDHRQIEKIVAELELLLDSHKVKRCWMAEHALAFLSIADRFAGTVIPHLHKEEEFFFPALEEFLPREEGPLAVLRDEHAQLRAHFRDVRDTGQKLVVGNGPPQLAGDFQKAGRAALQILRDHIYKQENVLFPMVGRMLAAERDNEILHQMEALGLTRTTEGSPGYSPD